MKRIAVGSDAATTVTGAVMDHLRNQGMEVLPTGTLAGSDATWVQVAVSVARTVVEGRADVGVLLCFTGTGVSIAANKVRGARAALCGDAETARGARRWNDANILVMSYRSASNTVAREILDAFMSTAVDAEERAVLDSLARFEEGEGC